MKVLFTCVVGPGHFHPMVPLARALEVVGHRVAFATDPGFCAYVRGVGFEAHPAGLNQREAGKRLDAVMPESEWEDIAPEDQSADQVDRGWNRAVDGLAEVLKILREDCGVVVPRWLPYTTMVIPAAAAWAAQKTSAHAAQVGGNRRKLARWFWCASLAQLYDTAPNTQAAKDFTELRRWMTDPQASPPDSVRGFALESSTLRGTTFRQRGLYRALMALVLRGSPFDFHKRGSISNQLFDDPDNPVDDHHIFPQGYLPSQVPPSLRDSILNRTLIDKITNIRIGKKAPSVYLSEIRDAWGGDEALAGLLDSHLLPSAPDSPLLLDDFDGFLTWRERRFAQEIAAVTGLPVDQIVDHQVASHIGSPSAGRVPDGRDGYEEAVPDDVLRLIDLRGSAWTRPLSREFASEALASQGVSLRVQASKGDPSYFQVRHPRFSQVVAYAHPRQSELHIEFRLSASHSAPSSVIRRNGTYGLVLKVRQSADLSTAMALLTEALQQ